MDEKKFKKKYNVSAPENVFDSLTLTVTVLRPTHVLVGVHHNQGLPSEQLRHVNVLARLRYVHAIWSYKEWTVS